MLTKPTFKALKAHHHRIFPMQAHTFHISVAAIHCCSPAPRQRRTARWQGDPLALTHGWTAWSGWGSPMAAAAHPRLAAAATPNYASALGAAAADAPLDLLGFTLILDDIVSPTGERQVFYLARLAARSLYSLLNVDPAMLCLPTHLPPVHARVPCLQQHGAAWRRGPSDDLGEHEPAAAGCQADRPATLEDGSHYGIGHFPALSSGPGPLACRASSCSVRSPATSPWRPGWALTCRHPLWTGCSCTALTLVRAHCAGTAISAGAALSAARYCCTPPAHSLALNPGSSPAEGCPCRPCLLFCSRRPGAAAGRGCGGAAVAHATCLADSGG